MSAGPSILVGVDFSVDSACALREAMRLAQSSGLRVCPVHVVDTLFPLPPGQNLGELSLSIREHHVRRAHEEWIRFTVRTPEARHLRLAVEVDSLAAGWARCTRAEAGVMLMIGLSGRPGDRLRPESLEAACLQGSLLPVLLVNASRPAPMTRVAVCIDYSDASRPALRHALRFAALCQASVQVLHLCRQEGSQEERECAVRLREFCGPEMRAMASSTIECDFLERPVRDEMLADHLSQRSVDLAVLGLREDGPCRSLFGGGRLERLTRVAPCSMLLVGPTHQQSLPERSWPSEDTVSYGLTA